MAIKNEKIKIKSVQIINIQPKILLGDFRGESPEYQTQQGDIQKVSVAVHLHDICCKRLNLFCVCVHFDRDSFSCRQTGC